MHPVADGEAAGSIGHTVSHLRPRTPANSLPGMNGTSSVTWYCSAIKSTSG